MELKSLSRKIKNGISKYRYAALILAVGIVLMLIPTSEGKDEADTSVPEVTEDVSIESRLAEILCSVEGAGKTKVLLTVMAGEEIIYQIDEQINIDNDSEETKITTITVTGKDKEENGLVKQVVSPVYLGAIVVCQGADKASVKFAIVDAVSKITGLGTDQISVLKMK